MATRGVPTEERQEISALLPTRPTIYFERSLAAAILRPFAGHHEDGGNSVAAKRGLGLAEQGLQIESRGRAHKIAEVQGNGRSPDLVKAESLMAFPRLFAVER